MKHKITSAAKFIFFLGIGILLFWLAFKDQNINEVISEFKKVNYFWVGLTLIIGLFSHYSRAVRWNMLIYPLGYRPKTTNTFLSLMIGYLANLAFPRMGEVVRCGALSRYEKVPVSSLIGTIITERIIDLIVLLLLVIIIFIFQIDILGDFTNEYVLIPFSKKVASGMEQKTLLFFIGLILLAFIGFGFLLFRKLKSLPLYLKIKEVIKGFWLGIKSVRTMQNRKLFIFHTIFIWVMYYFMTYLCFFSMDATEHLSPLVGLTILVMGSLGIVAPVQGGIGAYHWLVSQTLALYAINTTDALVFATVVHSAQTLLVLFGGFLSLLILPILNNKRNHPLEGGRGSLQNEPS